MDYNEKAEKMRAIAKKRVGDYFQKIEKIEAILKNLSASFPACSQDLALSKYVKGMLRPEEKARIEKHLKNCLHCATVVMFSKAQSRLWDKSYTKDRKATLILAMGNKLSGHLMKLDVRIKGQNKS